MLLCGTYARTKGFSSDSVADLDTGEKSFGGKFLEEI